MKNLFRLFGLLFILVFIQFSCHKPEEKFGNVEGIVVQVTTTSPISGVGLSIAGLSATTTSDGKFSIKNIPVGTHTLVATKSDYESYQTSMDITENSTQKVNIIMTSSILMKTLSGFVYNSETNQPVQGAKITLAQQIDYTDATGHYQIPNVPQGTYTIVAEKTGFINFSGNVLLSSSDKVFNMILLKGTEIKSGFSTNTTLTLANSPYYVRNDLSLGSVTLTIEPGVILKFDDNKGFAQSYYSANSKIIAEGTPNMPIVFTSSRNNPTPGNWKGLTIDNVSSNKLKNLKIEYAVIGIKVVYNESNFKYYWDKLTVEKTLIQNCITGVSGPISLTDGIIKDNSTGAEINWGEGFTGINVLFENNTIVGIITLNEENTPISCDFCSFINNKQGINSNYTTMSLSSMYLYGYGSTGVKNSIIKGNKGIGIINKGRPGFQNNNFISNSDYAFDRDSYLFWNSASSYDINNNYIAGNKGKSLSEVDISLDGSGGQYKTNSAATGTSIGNPRSTPNSNIGATWMGFK